MKFHTLQEASNLFFINTQKLISRNQLLQLAINGKIKLCMLYDGIAMIYEKDKEEIIREIYGWFNIPPRFFAELINNPSKAISINMFNSGDGNIDCVIQADSCTPFYATLDNIYLDENTLNLLIKLDKNQDEPKQESNIKAHPQDDVNNGDDTEKRCTRLYEEIAEIPKYKTIGKTAIRKILATYIDKTGSCIKSLSDDSISWTDWKGDKQITTNGSLGRWLTRQNRH